MKTLLLLAGLLSAIAAPAQELPLQALGDLEVAFATLQPTDRVPGPPLRAVVRARSGEAYRVQLPREANRVSFLAGNGEPVRRGEPVVRLEGPEIHHWRLEYEAVGQRLQTARSRYERNQSLYADGALSADRWTEIEDRFLDLKLEYEHMRHFAELLHDGSDEHVLLVGTPQDGVVIYRSGQVAAAAGATLFEIIPDKALRLEVQAPASRAAALRTLQVADCRLPVTAVDRAAQGFFVTAWSAPLDEACPWPPGTVLSARPEYAEDGLLVPHKALFQWQREPHVLLRTGDALSARRVVLVADTEQGYAIEADDALAGREVLIRSVSAAQGMLLGLGSE
jgi:hypothetical protein